MREQDEDEIFNNRKTTAQIINEMQAPINNQVEAPVLRRSTRNRIQREQKRKPNKPRLNYSKSDVLTFDVHIVSTGSC